MAIVKRETTLVERVAPLAPFAVTFLGGILKWVASGAEGLPLSPSDKDEWRKIQASAEEILQDADACDQEVLTLTLDRRNFSS